MPVKHAPSGRGLVLDIGNKVKSEAKIRALLASFEGAMSEDAISRRLRIDPRVVSEILESMYLASEVERRHVTLGEYGDRVRLEYRLSGRPVKV